MDPLMILMILGVLIGGAAIALPFILITLAAFIYVWTHMYPWLKMVGKWGARPANFIGLLSISALLFLLIVVVLVVLNPTRLEGILVIIPILIILFLLLCIFIVMIPVYLAVIVFIIRFIKWFFRLWSGWIDSVILALRLQIIKTKIKTDVLKEGGGKGKLRAFKGEFSGDARRVRGKVGGKKESGFKGKLEALRGEFSGDVDRARGRIFKRRK
jgi:hypothetical protein